MSTLEAASHHCSTTFQNDIRVWSYNCYLYKYPHKDSMKQWQQSRPYQLQASCICSCVFAISASKSSGKSTCHKAISLNFMILSSSYIFNTPGGCLQNYAGYDYPSQVFNYFAPSKCPRCLLRPRGAGVHWSRGSNHHSACWNSSASPETKTIKLKKKTYTQKKSIAWSIGRSEESS